MKKALRKKVFIVLTSFMLFFLNGQLSADSRNFSRSNNQIAKEVFVSNFGNGIYQINNKEKDLKSILITSFTEKLLENKHVLIDSNDYFTDFEESERTDSVIYKNQMEDIEFVRADIMLRSLTSSIKDTFHQTPFGERIKRLEENVARYFVVEYSKINSENKGHFYGPGELSVEEMKKEKDLKIALTASLYPKPNSLKEDFSAGLKGNYKKIKMNASYNFVKKMLGINLRTGNIKSFFGIGFDFYSKHYEDENVIGSSISIDF